MVLSHSTHAHSAEADVATNRQDNVATTAHDRRCGIAHPPAVHRTAAGSLAERRQECTRATRWPEVSLGGSLCWTGPASPRRDGRASTIHPYGSVYLSSGNTRIGVRVVFRFAKNSLPAAVASGESIRPSLRIVR